MEFSKVKLPSNIKFGYFFTVVFALIATYFLFKNISMWTYIFSILALVFFVITLFKPEILLPLNKLWMRIGLILGMIVSPIILGIMFFGLFTPTALIMRFRGRDELGIKIMNKDSNWIYRNHPIEAESFKRQF